jgi:hypothetical protein
VNYRTGQTTHVGDTPMGRRTMFQDSVKQVGTIVFPSLTKNVSRRYAEEHGDSRSYCRVCLAEPISEKLRSSVRLRVTCIRERSEHLRKCLRNASCSLRSPNTFHGDTRRCAEIRGGETLLLPISAPPRVSVLLELVSEANISENTHGVKIPLHRVGKVNSLKVRFGSRQGDNFRRSFSKKP